MAEGAPGACSIGITDGSKTSVSTTTGMRGVHHAELYTCDICGQEGLLEDDMRSHVLIEHVEGSVSCPFCDLEDIGVEEMNLHVNVEHLDFIMPIQQSVFISSPIGEADLMTDSEEKSDILASSPSLSESSAGKISCSTNTASTASTAPIRISITQPQDSPLHTLSCDTPTRCASPTQEEQSRKRAKLYLDVPQFTCAKNHHHDNLCKVNKPLCIDEIAMDYIDDVHKENIENTHRSSPLFDCPLCAWQTTSPNDIVRHVNLQHMDILSPAKSPRSQQTSDATNNNDVNSCDPSTSVVNFECPICSMVTQSAEELEEHVNAQHVDVLSPVKGQNSRNLSVSSSLSRSPSNLSCPVCGMEFGDVHDLTTHVHGHFSADQTPVAESTDGSSDTLLAQEIERRERAALKLQEQREFERLQDLYGMSGKNTYQRQAEKNLEKAVVSGELTVSDYYTHKAEAQQFNTMGVDDGHSTTKGIIEQLRQYYKVSSAGTIYKQWLCMSCDHYAASYGDKGWGCGYRNLQMLLSAMAANPTYQQVLFNGRPLIPSIAKIQRLIETAWQKGFDLQGSEQLGGKVVDTTKWIGATEIVATLSSLRVKCQLIDFHAPTGKDGTHPRLFEWVRDYFSRDIEYKHPLYLQHQGHSRTIIGVEEMKDGSLRLLLFDPSCSKRQMSQFLNMISPNLMRCIRRSPQGMKARQYQIVAAVGILTQQEYEESKEIRSDRIP